MKKLLILGVIMVLFIPYCTYARLGGAGATFLGIGGGARPVALGYAYSAVAEGPDAIFWNPAGLARIRQTSFSFSHAELFADMNYENFAFVYPLQDGAFGVSVIALLSGLIEETTLEHQEGTGDFYSANDYAVGVSYARMMTTKFSAGFTLRAVNQNIWKVSANGVVFDIGATYNAGYLNLRFGFVIQNFGPDMRYTGEGLEFLFVPSDYESTMEADVPGAFRSEAYSPPLTFQEGFAVDPIHNEIHRVTLSADLIHPNDQEETFGAGVEYSYQERFFARMGYTGKNNRKLSGGMGVRVGSINFDYAFETHEYLNPIHRISVTLIR